MAEKLEMAEERKFTKKDLLDFIDEAIARYPESSPILQTVRYRAELVEEISGRLRHCDSLDVVIPVLELAVINESNEEQKSFLRETLEDVKELKKDLKCG